MSFFSNLLQRLKGWRTFLLSVLVFLTGVASALEYIDLHALLRVFIKDEAVLGSVVAVISFLFMLLRFATSTGAFQSNTEDQE